MIVARSAVERLDPESSPNDKIRGFDLAAPSEKLTSGLPMGSPERLEARFVSVPRLTRPQAARSLRRYLRARSLAACSARVTPNPCLVRGDQFRMSLDTTEV
jgi:hypothetical protein